MVFKVFFVVFLPTTLALPGVMLLSRSTALRNSATNIEKTSRKGAPEQERPNTSVIIKIAWQLLSYKEKYVAVKMELLL